MQAEHLTPPDPSAPDDTAILFEVCVIAAIARAVEKMIDTIEEVPDDAQHLVYDLTQRLPQLERTLERRFFPKSAASEREASHG